MWATPAMSSASAGELATRADVELGEHLGQVVADGGRADKQLLGDLLVRRTRARQARDHLLLPGQVASRLTDPPAGVPAGRAELDACPFGESLGANRVEQVVRAA